MHRVHAHDYRQSVHAATTMNPLSWSLFKSSPRTVVKDPRSEDSAGLQNETLRTQIAPDGDSGFVEDSQPDMDDREPVNGALNGEEQEKGDANQSPPVKKRSSQKRLKKKRKSAQGADPLWQDDGNTIEDETEKLDERGLGQEIKGILNARSQSILDGGDLPENEVDQQVTSLIKSKSKRKKRLSKSRASGDELPNETPTAPGNYQDSNYRRAETPPSAQKPQEDSVEDVQDSEDDFNASQQLQESASSALEKESDESTATPLKPSKKALGKRKATDAPAAERSAKKSKHSKGKVLSKDIRAMMVENSRSTSRSQVIPDTPKPVESSKFFKTPSGRPTLIYNASEVSPDAEQATQRTPNLLMADSSSRSPAKAKYGLSPALGRRTAPETPQGLTSSRGADGEPPAPVINSEESELHPDTRQKIRDKAQETLTNESSAISLNKKRKRRLPVDEPGPSNSEKFVVAKTRTPSAGAPKTPTSKTKRRQSTSASKGNGKITHVDLATVSQLIEDYREEQGWSQSQINEVIQGHAHSEEGRPLWKAICEELPNIPTKLLQSTCRRKFHNFEGRGVWTPEQDVALRDAYHHNPDKWTVIGKIINRLPDDARDRWRNYVVCGDNMNKKTWSNDEEKTLKDIVAELVARLRSERQNFGESNLSDAYFESLLDWNRVSEMMGHTRSRLQCITKWKTIKIREQPELYDNTANTPISVSWRLKEAQLEAKALSAGEKLRLLRAIKDTGAALEGKIPWGSLQEELGEDGKRMAWKVCFRKLKERVPGQKGMLFTEILDYLIKAFEATAPDEPPGFDVAGPITTPGSEKRSTPKSLTAITSSMNGSSTASKRKSKSKAPAELTDKGEAKSKFSNRKQRFRERMRLLDEEGREPEINGGEVSVDDLPSSISRKSKRPLVQAKVKKPSRSSKRYYLSEEKVVEESDDEEIAEKTNAEHNAEIGAHADLNEEEPQIGSPAPQEEDVDVDQEEGYTLHHNNHDVVETGGSVFYAQEPDAPIAQEEGADISQMDVDGDDQLHESSLRNDAGEEMGEIGPDYDSRPEDSNAVESDENERDHNEFLDEEIDPPSSVESEDPAKIVYGNGHKYTTDEDEHLGDETLYDPPRGSMSPAEEVEVDNHEAVYEYHDPQHGGDNRASEDRTSYDALSAHHDNESVDLDSPVKKSPDDQQFGQSTQTTFGTRIIEEPESFYATQRGSSASSYASTIPAGIANKLVTKASNSIPQDAELEDEQEFVPIVSDLAPQPDAQPKSTSKKMKKKKRSKKKSKKEERLGSVEL